GSCKTRSRSFQNSLQVFQHTRGLLADAACDYLLRNRVQRNLAGCEHKISRAHSLRVRPDGGRSRRRCNDLFVHAPIVTPLQAATRGLPQPYRLALPALGASHWKTACFPLCPLESLSALAQPPDSASPRAVTSMRPSGPRRSSLAQRSSLRRALAS